MVTTGCFTVIKLSTELRGSQGECPEGTTPNSIVAHAHQRSTWGQSGHTSEIVVEVEIPGWGIVCRTRPDKPVCGHGAVEETDDRGV